MFRQVFGRLVRRGRSASTLHAAAGRAPDRAVDFFDELEPRKLLANFVVDVATDVSNPVDGLTTLREAITMANAQPGADEITFDESLAFSTITLTQGELSIKDSLKIEGLDANRLAISGNDVSRVFNIETNAADVEIAKLTITGGFNEDSSGSGAGIYTGSNVGLTLKQVAVRANEAAAANGFGGGLYMGVGGTLTIKNSLFADNRAGWGGAMFIEENGTSTLDGVTISGNRTQRNGGGLLIQGSATGTTLIRSSTITNNISDSGSSLGWSGGISTEGVENHTTLISTIVSGNFIDGGATHSNIRNTGVDQGASFNNIIGTTEIPWVDGDNENIVTNDPGLMKLDFFGGDFETHALEEDSPAIDKGLNPANAVREGRASSFYTRTFGNATDIGAFERQTIQLDVSNESDEVDLVLDPGELSLREALRETNANPGSDIITFDALAPINPDGSFINLQSQLEVTDSTTIAGDGADTVRVSGGFSHRVFHVFDAEKTANVTFIGFTIAFGRVDNGEDGAGIRSFENLFLQDMHIHSNRASGNTANGGGIDAADGMLQIFGSTIEGNFATDGGGGITIRGAVDSFYITDSTIADNRTDANGGGLAIFAPGTILNSTIADNRANVDGGGIFLTATQETVTLNNTIVADNWKGFSGTPLDIGGTAASIDYANSAHNLIQDAGTSADFADGVNNNLVGQDADLQQLRNYGGALPTIALGQNSAAIDAANTNPVYVEQRRGPFERVVGASQDIGAYEKQTLEFLVDKLGDEDDGDYGAGELTLREALKFVRNFDTDSIDFDPLLAGQTITLGGQSLEILGSVSINGLGADKLTIDADGLSRVFDIDFFDTGGVSIRDLSITGGKSAGSGAGINSGVGSLTLEGLHVYGNTSENNGGGLQAEHAIIRDSTFSDNEGDGYGGAAVFRQSFDIENSTFSNNRAKDVAGALFIGYSTEGVIRNSTFFGNQADIDNVGDRFGGAIASRNDFGVSETFSLISNVFAGNTAAGVANDLALANDDKLDAAASFNNMFADAGSTSGLVDGVNANRVGVDPLLAPLAMNGGPTPTHALRSGSPAINAGLDNKGLNDDQRGFGRSLAGAVDVGAFEFRPVVLNSFSISDLTFSRGKGAILSARPTPGDGTVDRVDYYVDLNQNGLPDANELVGSSSDASNDYAFDYKPDRSTPLGKFKLLYQAVDSAGLTSAVRNYEITLISGRPTIASVAFSSLEFAQGDRVTVTTTLDGDSETDGVVRFYFDRNGNGQFDPFSDTLLGEDADGSDGFSYTLSPQQTAEFGVGINNVLAVASDGFGDDDSPVVQSANVLYSLRAGLESDVTGSSDAGDNHRLVTINQAGDPVVFEQEGWDGVNLALEIGAPKGIGNAETWTDPKDGLVYAAYPSGDGLILLQRSVTGAWSFRNLGNELGAAVVTQITQFTSAAGTGRVVVIAGQTATGELVAFQQTGASTSAGFEFRLVDISQSLSDNGFTTPELTELISYRPSWDAWHLAGINASGDIISVWQPPRSSDWRVDNLSNITGAAPLAGGLSVILTSWNGITLTGLDQSGDVVSTWWVPSFGGDWQQVNLTTAFNGPKLENAALTSFYTPWNAQNYAGVNAAGEIVVYWWVPSFGGEWRTDVLTTAQNESTRITSQLNAHVSSQNTLNVFGAAEDGSVVRASWQPGSSWGLENLTEDAARVS